ncbi:hypothetical protein Patl_1339 [Paraglaciecola sp. T6c]|uniref:exosortase-dependent surface protein XDP1 n=1 Tax=Pseudoalteromonas atlantica (strain T6c / ATCC BAA-1087) TaxID=3042615 RepID=UPI00005C755A|nr:exosortase-dependent surface protein XDP1 [Paraglaciecola sp. T6c]ABG39865.1 hypothetical protein Patl_1339 [Paraglaciecola sp. T6c]
MKKQLILRSAAIAASLMTMSFASFATDTTEWNFRSYGGNDYGTGNSTSSYGNTLNFSSSSNSLSVTAWADTNEISGPDTVENATAANNGYGLLNYNRNSDGHTVDNSGDTDMLLFSFDDLVSITGINIGYYSNDSDISIAAFDDLPTLQGQSWESVASTASFSASFANIGNGWSSLDTESTEAQYWIVGAYNSSFGGASGAGAGWSDNLKIAGLSTVAGIGPDPKPPTDVAEPSSLAVLASFGLFAVWRRRKTA